ncbi:putative ribonuclease H protein [Sesamum alatum]|uniref:Ribonuclease H protein n=1 Tax=Sesamum alatum TaxID=300844 RepID=A0AAE1XSJ6_9LAMI|nr:putative ribonuclease H protein [Sesamum alatum]
MLWFPSWFYMTGAASDSLVRHFSKNGVFSVQSVYNVAVELLSRDSAGQSGLGEAPKGGWDFLWKLKIPAKVKVFVWRTCNQALPTAMNLQRCHLLVQNLRLYCSSEGEDSKHIMLSCDFARQTWAGLLLICRGPPS